MKDKVACNSQVWENWNTKLMLDYESFEGFDGIDWDLEGNDDQSYDVLNPSVLQLVGEMCQVSV